MYSVLYGIQFWLGTFWLLIRTWHLDNPGAVIICIKQQYFLLLGYNIIQERTTVCKVEKSSHYSSLRQWCANPGTPNPNPNPNPPLCLESKSKQFLKPCYWISRLGWYSKGILDISGILMELYSFKWLNFSALQTAVRSKHWLIDRYQKKHGPGVWH